MFIWILMAVSEAEAKAEPQSTPQSSAAAAVFFGTRIALDHGASTLMWLETSPPNKPKGAMHASISLDRIV